MPDALHDGLILASHETADLERAVGGKGMNLTRLVRGGLQVPPFFVVGTPCFRACVDQPAVREAITQALRERDVTVLAEGEAASAAIRAAILAAAVEGLEPLVAQGLEEAIPPVDGELPFVAVRSSCVGEDSAQASFAGQMDSYLFVRGPTDVAQAVKRCWASAFGARALAYRVQQGMDPADVDMAVVVQEMIGGEVSGVMFTACPTTGRRDLVVVSSTWGLGEGLVSGELAADTFSATKADGALLETDLQPKEARVVFDTERGGGTKTEPVPPEQREQASLSPAQVAALTAQGRKIEALYDGEYQDVEWTRRGDQLYLLQARPITQLPPPPPEGFERLWDNSNIIESYSGVTSPMTFSHIRYAYGIAYRESCEIWGLPRETIKDLDQTFNSMLGLIDGNVYYNLESWYKLLAAFPNFEENAAHMEQMLGVRASAEVILSRVLATMPHYDAKQQRAIKRAGWRNFRGTDALTAEFMRNFREVYDHYDGSDWDALSLQELYAAFQDMRKRMLWRWQAPLVTDALAMRFVGKLKELTVQYGLDETGGFQNDLLCGEGGIESAEPTNMLIRLAQGARGNPALREFLEQTPDEEVMARLPARQDLAAFKAQIDEYLRKYGFRCMNELKLEERSLRDEPKFLFTMLKNYVRQDDLTVEAMESRQLEKRQAAEATARRKLGLFKRWWYFWVLNQARKHVKNRENMRFCRTRGFGLFRELLNAMGRKLVDRGELDEPQDIYYLEVEEVMGWVDGTVSCADLRGLAGVRKAEFTRYRERPEPDDRIVTKGAVHAGNVFRQPPPVVEGDGTLRGTPCCPGVVRGTVRVIRSAQDDLSLNGEILVAARTDPGWVPLYPSASGLLIERGSLLSHSAIMAREHGLPAIVNIPNLIAQVEDGMTVEMDATAGVVRIIDDETASA